MTDTKQISYKDGYKYQLTQDVVITLPWVTSDSMWQTKVSVPFLTLGPLGILTIRAGYAWDGPSGPTIDTKDFMRASLVHDALYQLLRQGYLGRSVSSAWRKHADKLLRQMCIEDGMPKWRAAYAYWAVRNFGWSSSENKKPVHTAP